MSNRASLPAPIPSETELAETIGDAVFCNNSKDWKSWGYAQQLEEVQNFDRITALIYDLTQEMLRAPDRVAAASVAVRIAKAMDVISRQGWRDLSEYASEERDARQGVA